MSKRGFSLIELLIVVALLAVLGAVVAPVHMQSRTRAELARARADMQRLISTAEAYRIDHYSYMLDNIRINGALQPDMASWTLLTTPVAYLASVPQSPFREYKNKTGGGYSGSDGNDGNYYEYWNGSFTSGGGYVIDAGASATGLYWRASSNGPDNLSNLHNMYLPGGLTVAAIVNRNPVFVNSLYDPSNGTVSRGDLFFCNLGLLQ